MTGFLMGTGVGMFVGMLLTMGRELPRSPAETADHLQRRIWRWPLLRSARRSGLYGTRVARGNTVDLLLNGDQIFPTFLNVIRSASPPRKKLFRSQFGCVCDRRRRTLEKIFADDLVYSRKVDPRIPPRQSPSASGLWSRSPRSRRRSPRYLGRPKGVGCRCRVNGRRGAFPECANESMGWFIAASRSFQVRHARFT
jgi:hypothetical protein